MVFKIVAYFEIVCNFVYYYQLDPSRIRWMQDGRRLVRPNFRLKPKIRLPKQWQTNRRMKIEDWLRPCKNFGEPFSSGGMRWIIHQQKIFRVSNRNISC